MILYYISVYIISLNNQDGCNLHFLFHLFSLYELSDKYRIQNKNELPNCKYKCFSDDLGIFFKKSPMEKISGIFLDSLIYLHHSSCFKYPSDVLGASQVALQVNSPSASAGRYKKLRFSPWVGKICRRAQQSTPVFQPGESHGQRSLAGYSLQGRKKSDTTEVT